MHLSISVIAELNWLLKHPKNRNKSLQNIPVSCKILTDASEKGWRATHKNTLIGGRQSSLKRNEMNGLKIKELKPILLVLKPYFRDNGNVKQVGILTDNSTGYISTH